MLKCTHIRIRDNNDYDFNVENLIKSLEAKYKVDFRCLPRWKELVQCLHVAGTDCKRRIQEARLRKKMIINKLYIQSTRPSPFELTSGLCRTASKWRKMEADLKKLKSAEALEINTEAPILTESGGTENLHPNTSISSASQRISSIELEPSKIDVEVQVELEVPGSHLPAVISTNPHKLLSPLGSHSYDIGYTRKSQFSVSEAPSESVKEEWKYLKPTSSVVCIPTPIILTSNTLDQQFVQFTVVNCAGDYMHIRFKSVMDHSSFLTAKIFPAIPKRLYPGIPVLYKLIFRLKKQEEFNSGLYFKVGGDVCDNIPPEALCIPIVSAFSKIHTVIVSETITMPPVYPWHIKRSGKYSTATIKISVMDPYYYHLHIYKRLIDLSKESDMGLSLQASGVNTQSVEEREMDYVADDATIVSMPKVENGTDSINIIESMDYIVKSIIELALNTFVFESTYLFLKPYEKLKIPVYFTKCERIGYHNSYYELELLEPETEKLIMTKTLKVFAEVLPHPIQIQPKILDMSNSPITHGYIEDHFVITNHHKLYLATIKIKLTTKMKKIINVSPMETTVPALTSVRFRVKFCSRGFMSATQEPFEDLVYFTFKIIVLGHKSVYENVPPLFYEVIAPCAVEFKKVYNEKYFKEESSLVLNLD